MARTNSFSQLSNEMPSEYNYATSTSPEWRDIRNNLTSNNPNTNEIGILPINQASLIFSLNSMQARENYISPEAEFPHPDTHWHNSQTFFNQDRAEYQRMPANLDPNYHTYYTYPTTQDIYPHNQLGLDTVFDNFFPPTNLLEDPYYFQALSIPQIDQQSVFLTPAAGSTSSHPSYISSENSASPPSSAVSPPNKIYTCSICSKTLPKKHLFNRHMELHTKPITCPISTCAHRTAKSRDMWRHVAAQHRKYTKAQGLPAPPRPVCPVLGCEYALRGFARPDHLKRHIQKQHPGRVP